MAVLSDVRQIAAKAGLEGNIHAVNIEILLHSLPFDIAMNIVKCLDAWAVGYNTSGYENPVSICSTLLYRHKNGYDSFLQPQHVVDVFRLQQEIALLLKDTDKAKEAVE